ncbi:TPA: hypothetical protein QDB28_004009 [Burkholderia vietnamiensis]|nr:hypothetical protein [Burkholderia vietnamiensis]
MTHEVKHTFTEYVETPDHEKRTESALFRKNKRTLVRQLGLGCWICGRKESPEVHHLHEWSVWGALDPEKVLDTLHVFDPYGYTHNMGDMPIESPDDIRNLLVLCGECEIDGVPVPGGHHRGIDAGVHDVTFPTWVAQRAVKDGMSITKAIQHVKAVDHHLKGSKQA